MMRLTAMISGKVQRVGYRAKVVSAAQNLGLTGFVQNRPDGHVLLIAEGSRENLEKLASAIKIKDLLIDVHEIESEFSEASGAYPTFRKMTGPDEVGERLDDGIEILKELVVGVRVIASNTEKLLSITGNGFAELNGKMDQMLDKQDQMLDKQDQMLDKQDQMLDKQDSTIGEIQKLRSDMKCHLDRRFDRIEGYLNVQKEESLP
ncbi:MULTISPECIES: acylphosphatase [Methanothrix]|jgi:acylphosphatase|nr:MULTISPECIES: acylphosphatase [Methanothrix]MDY0411672.1 acylphosphatase [Methanothrix soehngenii]HNQ52727.1 acylphosphatase [Methanothrix soehngenii]HNT46680.1 acylphosphatase [Methanothrix soehngenii]HNY33566.1 acylphosphatase [Methanothrix soehngenii]HOE46093.1 acylphosphatase [Methanothrix soehngenii]